MPGQGKKQKLTTSGGDDTSLTPTTATKQGAFGATRDGQDQKRKTLLEALKKQKGAGKSFLAAPTGSKKSSLATSLNEAGKARSSNLKVQFDSITKQRIAKKPTLNLKPVQSKVTQRGSQPKLNVLGLVCKTPAVQDNTVGGTNNLIYLNAEKQAYTEAQNNESQALGHAVGKYYFVTPGLESYLNQGLAQQGVANAQPVHEPQFEAEPPVAADADEDGDGVDTGSVRDDASVVGQPAPSVNVSVAPTSNTAAMAPKAVEYGVWHQHRLAGTRMPSLLQISKGSYSGASALGEEAQYLMYPGAPVQTGRYEVSFDKKQGSGPLILYPELNLGQVAKDKNTHAPRKIGAPPDSSTPSVDANEDSSRLYPFAEVLLSSQYDDPVKPVVSTALLQASSQTSNFRASIGDASTMQITENPEAAADDAGYAMQVDESQKGTSTGRFRAKLEAMMKKERDEFVRSAEVAACNVGGGDQRPYPGQGKPWSAYCAANIALAGHLESLIAGLEQQHADGMLTVDANGLVVRPNAAVSGAMGNFERDMSAVVECDGATTRINYDMLNACLHLCNYLATLASPSCKSHPPRMPTPSAKRAHDEDEKIRTFVEGVRNYAAIVMAEQVVHRRIHMPGQFLTPFQETCRLAPKQDGLSRRELSPEFTPAVINKLMAVPAYGLAVVQAADFETGNPDVSVALQQAMMMQGKRVPEAWVSYVLSEILDNNNLTVGAESVALQQPLGTFKIGLKPVVCLESTQVAKEVNADIPNFDGIVTAHDTTLCYNLFGLKAVAYCGVPSLRHFQTWLRLVFPYAPFIVGCYGMSARENPLPKNGPGNGGDTLDPIDPSGPLHGPATYPDYLELLNGMPVAIAQTGIPIRRSYLKARFLMNQSDAGTWSDAAYPKPTNAEDDANFIEMRPKGTGKYAKSDPYNWAFDAPKIASHGFCAIGGFEATQFSKQMNADGIEYFAIGDGTAALSMEFRSKGGFENKEDLKAAMEQNENALDELIMLNCPDVSASVDAYLDKVSADVKLDASDTSGARLAKAAAHYAERKKTVSDDDDEIEPPFVLALQSSYLFYAVTKQTVNDVRDKFPVLYQ